MMNVIIIDDEQDSLDALKYQLREHFPINILGEANSVDEGVKLVENNLDADVLFLDIEMQDGTGFDLLNLVQIKCNIPVIFTTAHESYAIKAIQYSAIDYIVKPVQSDDLKKAITNLNNRKQQTKDQISFLLDTIDKKTPITRITLPILQGYTIVDIDKLLYLEAEASYTNVFLSDGPNYCVSKNLSEFERLLADHNFIRIHRKYLVNVGVITQFSREDGGFVVLSNDKRLDISRRKLEEVNQAIMRAL